jgi:hypothetical protein
MRYADRKDSNPVRMLGGVLLLSFLVVLVALWLLFS